MPPRPFSITTTSSVITLDAQLRAKATFTVLNQTGRAVRARAIVAAEAPLDPTWIGLGEPVDRDFAPAEAEQFVVTIAVPAGTAAGQYRFRIDAAEQGQADDQATAGQVVAFDVPYVEPIVVPEPRGYLRTWLGALIGALAGGIAIGAIGLVLGFVLSSGVEPSAPDTPAPTDLGEAIAQGIALGIGAGIGVVFVIIGLLLIGGLIGLWAGSAIGSWLALRMGDYPTPWKTAVPLVVIFPVSTFLLIFLLSRLLAFEPPGVIGFIAFLVALAGTFSLPALGGRAFYRWRTTGGL
jgi:hypothetical protein